MQKSEIEGRQGRIYRDTYYAKGQVCTGTPLPSEDVSAMDVVLSTAPCGQGTPNAAPDIVVLGAFPSSHLRSTPSAAMALAD